MNPFVTQYLDKQIIGKLIELSSELENVSDLSLKGKSIALCFFENSTRTKMSFELAAKSLGINVLDLNPETSSLSKGETYLDTLQTLESMGVDAIVMRCTEDGLIDELQQNLSIPIISAGQGTTDHPTQGLLDILTIADKANQIGKELSDLRVTLVGDIKHSRVSASDIHIFNQMGLKVGIWAPDLFMPDDNKNQYVRFDNREQTIENSDFLIALRIQKERLTSTGITSDEAINIIKDYQIGKSDLNIKKELYLMHPGPVNWSSELSEDIKDSERSLIRTQVENGVRMRKAILYYLLQSKI